MGTQAIIFKNTDNTDNCDESIEHSKEDFLDTIRSLKLASSGKSVKYLLTSQKWVADIGSF